MKTYKSFINSKAIEEDTIAFSYSDGGKDQIVSITGSSSQIRKVKKNLPDGTKFIKHAPDDAMEISASDWLNLK